MIILLLLFSFVFSHEIRQDLKSHKNWKLVDRGNDCGDSYSERIIGGQEAALGQYPWIARICYLFTLEKTLQFPPQTICSGCGGTIINNRYIVTAAHCQAKIVQSLSNQGIGAYNPKVKLVQVRLGEHNTKTDPDCVNKFCAPKVQDIAVEEEDCHSGYNSTTFHNDICLIRLAKPIEFNDFVYPICLPAYNTFLGSSFENLTMEVAGWGLTDIASKTESNTLQTLKLPVISNQKCVASYTNIPKKRTIVSNQMCAGGKIGKDSCSGDSGGPLMKPFSLNAPPRYFLVGIVSFGPVHCAEDEIPGVYTRVAEYMPWILDQIRK